MENNIATTENKNTFTTIEKNLLLNAGRTIGKTFWLKKARYTDEITKIENDFSAAQDEELQKMIAEFRAKSEARLEKKLASLKGKVAAIDAEQALWENIIIEKTGHRAEEIFDFEITTSDTGKKSVKASFKYPDVLPPAGTAEPECPNHEDEDRDADIDEDMDGEFTELPMPEEPAVIAEDDTPWDDNAVAAQTSPIDDEPEYDSAGFSTEDGLQEGEPAKLAEQIAAEEIADISAIMPEAGNDFDADREAAERQWAEEKAQADQMIEAFAEGIDEAVNTAVDVASEDDDDNPFSI